jgi:hypothetical protein
MHSLLKELGVTGGTPEATRKLLEKRVPVAAMRNAMREHLASRAK